MEKHQNEKIIQSWKENANVWTNTVRTQALESRRLVTNDAILNAVCNCGGTSILDVGCGEGWLSYELAKKGKDVIGFDVSAALIEQATNDSSAKFQVMSYEQFIADPQAIGQNFEVVVCNFSLLGDRLDEIFKAIHRITTPSGHLIIQTLHPHSSTDDVRYEDGWQEETFQDLPGHWSPMPWYFRTMSSWVNELMGATWKINEMKEPLHPSTGRPASLILDSVK